MNTFESEIIQKIEKNFEKIKDDFKSKIKKRDFERYFIIKERYENEVNIEKDKEFQNIYKIFYVMRFVTNEYITKYFNLLNTKKFKTQNDLGILLEKMDGILGCRGKNNMQFAFITKLLHTANNDLPIYDRFVAQFFRLEATPNDINIDLKFRIETRERIYKKLITKINSLLSQDKIKKYIKDIRIILSDLDGIDSISDIKMLDFIILSCENVNKNLVNNNK